MLRIIRTVIVSLFIFTVITGILYPLAVTGIAQLLFPIQANGSVITKNEKPAGSCLIGQHFDNPKYFWGRLSATSPFPYNAAYSSGSNRAQTNPDLVKQAQDRISALRHADTENTSLVPADLITSSGSGLDPHISLASVEYQIKRVSKVRGLDETEVRAIVTRYTEGRQLGILGEPRVNVLKLNMALDEIRLKMD